MPDKILAQRLRKSAIGKYVLRLYVAGKTPKSIAAITNLKAICESHLKEKYELTVVDLCHDRKRALLDQILVAPTLIKQSPLPMRRMIGGFSQTDRVLAILDLPATVLSP
jgi:circadian clock protein KaiB